MGLGKITRGLGKVGLAIEAARYAWIGGKALWEAVRGQRSKEEANDPASGAENQEAEQDAIDHR